MLFRSIHENINGINGNTIQFPVNGPGFSSVTDQDSFSTTNQFYGAQLGGRLTWENKWFDAGAFAKLGLGATMQRVNINGTTTFFSPAGNQTVTGGLLALSSNIGTYNRTVFGVLPEMGFNFGVHFNDHVRLNFGYSCMLWNRVVRPDMQYDHNVNTNLAPTGNFNPGNVTGLVSPQFRFNDELFWINSFKVGLEFRY